MPDPMNFRSNPVTPRGEDALTNERRFRGALEQALSRGDTYLQTLENRIAAVAARIEQVEAWAANTFQFAGYGAIRLTPVDGGTPGNNITDVYSRFFVCDDLYIDGPGVSFAFPDIFIVEEAGVIEIGLNIAFACNKLANDTRVVEISVYDIAADANLGIIGYITIPENTNWAASSGTVTASVTPAAINRQLTLRARTLSPVGSSVTNIVWYVQGFNIRFTSASPDAAMALL